MVGSFKAGPEREVVGGLLAARLASPTHIPRVTLIEIVQGVVKIKPLKCLSHLKIR